MAFTRKFLSALGIEQDKVDEIMQAHIEVTDALKEERDNLKDSVSELADVKAERDKLKEEVDELKKGGDDKLQEKYDKLKGEYDDYKAEVAKAEAKRDKVSAYRNLLKAEGVSEKRIDSIIKVSDEVIEALELDDDKNVKDSEKVAESIKKDWADFIVKESTVGAKTSTPPANNGGGTMTKEDIMKIKDAGERQKAIAENHELFGF